MYKHVVVVLNKVSKLAWLFPKETAKDKEAIDRSTKRQNTFGPNRLSKILHQRSSLYFKKFEKRRIEENIKHVNDNH